MPRDKGQEHLVDAPYPITAQEVRLMLREAEAGKFSRFSALDEKDCSDLAQFLTGLTRTALNARSDELSVGVYRPSETDARFRQRWEDAIRLLLRTNEHPGSFSWPWNIDRATAILEDAIREAKILLDANQRSSNWPSQQKKWVRWVLPIVFTMSGVYADVGGRGGTSRNSVAVKFAALALERIGWRDEHGRAIKASAIARHCAESRPAHNDHNLP